MPFIIKAEGDTEEWKSKNGESIDQFIGRLMSRYEFQLNEADIFQIWDGPGIYGFVNKAGDWSACSCSISQVTRGGCNCGAYARVEISQG